MKNPAGGYLRKQSRDSLVSYVAVPWNCDIVARWLKSHGNRAHAVTTRQRRHGEKANRPLHSKDTCLQQVGVDHRESQRLSDSELQSTSTTQFNSFNVLGRWRYAPPPENSLKGDNCQQKNFVPAFRKEDGRI